MDTLSIVVPAYNERPTLLTVLCRVLDVDLRPLALRKQVVVVDDCSTDGTRGIVESLGKDWRAALAEPMERHGIDARRATGDADVQVVLHPRNRGKGAALRSGFAAATGRYVLVQDADLEYDPRDYPVLLRPLLEDRADVVFGSRFLPSEHRVLFFWHSLGNQALTLLSNAFTDLNLTDMETGYKVFRADVLRSIKLESERFGFEPEVTTKVAKMRYRVFEVPISYNGRDYASGKKITWKDGVEAVWCLLKYGLSDDFAEGPLLEQALQKTSAMARFSKHLYETIRPFVGRSIVEAGSGHGAITDYLVSRGDVYATDVDEVALRRLRSEYALHDHVRVARWDMTEAFPEPLDPPPDTVVCLNVLQHVGDERAALGQAHRLLAPTGGRLILLVPAHPALYSPMDRRMGHHRRYSRAALRALLDATGFDVEHLQWFNLLGLAGWWWNGKVLGRAALPPGHLSAYRWISASWLSVEAGSNLPVGLSLVAVAKARPDGR